jgi:glycosyltransferase involved in cell wall biosynthesis
MGWHLKSYMQGLTAAKRVGIPVIVRGDSHLVTPRSPLKKIGKELAYPLFLRMFDAVLYVGLRSRAYYEHYRYPAKRQFFSPHCIDTAWFAAGSTVGARNRLRERLGISRETRVLLFAGKLVPFKRPMDLLSAAAECRARGADVEVMIAGDGELRDPLNVEAKTLGLPVHFLGFCNQTEMPAAYAAADCLILPSDGRETWGLVANEALACSCPIIVSDACGCAPDLARDGLAGRMFAVGAISSLTAVILDVIASPPTREEIAKVSNAHCTDAAANGVMAALQALRGDQT